MAVFTNTFTTYAAVGQREDLSDLVDMISPTERPFGALLSNRKA